MADDERDENENEQEELSTKDRQGREAAEALNKMTDKGPERQMDEGKVQQAMQALAEAQRASKDAERQRERELAAVKVAAADVEVLATELELDKKAAERSLREAGGDLRRALEAYLGLQAAA